MMQVYRSAQDVFALERAGVRPEDLADDGADLAGKTVRKPWGYEVEMHRSGALSISRLVLNADAETSLHCHTLKSVVLMVESGVVRVETLAISWVLQPGDAVRLQAGVFHRTVNVRGEQAVLIELETPANKRDLVRIDDRYGREGQGYERETR